MKRFDRFGIVINQMAEELVDSKIFGVSVYVFGEQVGAGGYMSIENTNKALYELWAGGGGLLDWIFFCFRTECMFQDKFLFECRQSTKLLLQQRTARFD